MLQKIVIVLIIIVIGILTVVGYSVWNRSPHENERVSIDDTTSTSSGTTIEGESHTSTQSVSEPIHREMRTGSTMQAGSGVTVTISTNGPASRPMTSEELIEFQQKIRGK